MAFKPPHGALGNAKNNPKNHQRSKMTQTRAETARSTQFFSSLLEAGGEQLPALSFLWQTNQTFRLRSPANYPTALNSPLHPSLRPPINFHMNTRNFAG